MGETVQAHMSNQTMLKTFTNEFATVGRKVVASFNNPRRHFTENDETWSPRESDAEKMER